MGKTKQQTEVVTLPEIYKEYPQLQKYNVADIAIAKMEAEFSKLSISDLKDTAGYKKVSSAIAIVRSKRIEVEKVRKELKADSLNYGRIVDSEAKRIQALIEPIETKLQSEKDRIDNEKENIRLEKERKLQELLDSRKNKLFEIGMIFDISGNLYYGEDYKTTISELQVLADDVFAEYCRAVESRVKADQEAKATEVAEQEKKRHELIAESERLEKLRQEQAEAQAKIEEENKKIQAEKDKIQREKEMAEFKLKAEAEAKANAEKLAQEQIRLQKEKADAEIKKLQDEADKEKQDRLKAEKLGKERLEEEQRQKELAPDKEKILKYVESLKLLPKPELKSAKMKKIMEDILTLVDKIETFAIAQTGGKK